MTARDLAGEEAFGPYSAKCTEIMRRILRQRPLGSLDEQAFPAYLEGNPASRWLFWRRIEFAYRYVGQSGRQVQTVAAKEGVDTTPLQNACMDFGCGSGLLLPRLRAQFSTVYGVDLRPEAATTFLADWFDKTSIARPGIRLLTDVMAPEIAKGSLDLILALDVLEHITDLTPLLTRFAEVLKPGTGAMLISGPTENFLYKLGRKIVGFSGDYHVQNIATIRKTMEPFFQVRLLKNLYWPASLFWILEARPRRPAS